MIGNFVGRSTNVIWRDFKTYQNYAYGVADGATNSLQIFDLQYLPDSVVKIYDEDSLSRSCHNIFIEGNRAYMADNHRFVGSVQQRFSLEVLSLANPTNPVRIGTLNTGGLFNETHDVFVRNDTAYCSGGNQGLFIYDYRNAAAPQLISSITAYPEKGYNHSSWVTEDGKTLVFADETHGSALKVYDISTITSPVLKYIFRSNPGAIVHNPFIIGDSVYLSYYHDGAQIFDISDSIQARRVAFYDTYPNNVGYQGFEGAWGIYPFLPSKKIIVSDISTGLYVLELLPVTSPPAVGFSIGAEKGCGPYTVEIINTTANANSTSWTVNKGNQLIFTSNLEQPSFTFIAPGVYTVKLIASNALGSDSSIQNISVGTQPAVILPYFEDFNDLQADVCIETRANSDIVILGSNGISGSGVLQFRGGDGANYVSGQTCDNTFAQNPTYVAKAGLRVNVAVYSTASMTFSLRYQNLGSAADSTKSNFRMRVNGIPLGNCQRSQIQTFQSQTHDLSSFLGPNVDTLYIEFETVNRFFRITNSILDRIFLDNLSISGTVAGLNTQISEKLRVSIFPNPSTGLVQIEMKELSSSPVNVALLDAQGRIVYQQDHLISASKALDFGKLSAGYYIMQISDGSSLYREPILISQH